MRLELTVDGVVYVPKKNESNDETFARNSSGLNYCIVRCAGAGVHAGYLAKKNGEEVVLFNSRRLWRWHGRTLSGLAIEGTDAPEKCKFGDVLPEITLLGVCEIIPTSESARKSLEGVKRWENEK